MRGLVFLLFLLVLPLAQAQETSLFETFEDENLSQEVPASNWYSALVSDGTMGGADHGVINALNGQAWQIDDTNSGDGSLMLQLELNDPQQIDSLVVTFRAGMPTSGSGNYLCTLAFNDETFDTANTGTDASAALGAVRRQNSGAWEILGPSDVGTIGTFQDTVNLLVEFDWVNETYSATIEGVTVEKDFRTHDGQNSVFWLTLDTGFGQCIIDDLALNGLEPAAGEVIREGSEFDTGLVGFAESFGFVSAPGQMLFSLILIGMATVATGAASKWVNAGRFKNYLLLSAQALLAVFCVVASLLDLWMLLVALMLGIFAVRGSGEAKNTWAEIRDNLRRSRQPVDLSDRMADTAFEFSLKDQERQEGLDAALDALEASGGQVDQEREEKPRRGDSDASGDA